MDIPATGHFFFTPGMGIPQRCFPESLFFAYPLFGLESDVRSFPRSPVFFAHYRVYFPDTPAAALGPGDRYFPFQMIHLLPPWRGDRIRFFFRMPPDLFPAPRH